MSICPECKIRDNDPSLKELHKCPFCEREFCVIHLDPKLAFFSASFHTDIIKDKKFREMVEDEIQRDDAHPCIPYTIKRIEEIRHENEKLAQQLKKSMDKVKKPLPPQVATITTQASPEIIIKKSEKRSIGNIKYAVAFFIFLIIILIYFLIQALL